MATDHTHHVSRAKMIRNIQTGGGYELTDLGNAHRLVDLRGIDIHYVPN